MRRNRELFVVNKKLGNLLGCFTFYRASALKTFTKHRSLSFDLFTEFFLFFSVLMSVSLCVYVYPYICLHQQIYNLLLLIKNFYRLTLKIVITIYLETLLHKFNSTCLHMRDVNTSSCQTI